MKKVDQKKAAKLSGLQNLHTGIEVCQNHGILVLRDSRSDDGGHNEPITVIVSGVGRSGTSMVAKLLHTIGIPMGDTDGLAVYEDRALNTALFQLDHTRLRKLIHEQNVARDRWGFKFASLQNHIFPPQLEYFRNPHLIIVMRDVIATATRAYISDADRKGFEATLINVTEQSANMLKFVTNASCPTLLISYEQFVSSPETGIEAVAEFCGIAVTEELHRGALRAVEPNNAQYIELFHPGYRGNFDSVKEGHVLGWCAADGRDDPVEVEFLANGKVLAVFTADVFRPDLLAAGIGSGFHGFRLDVSGLALTDDMILQVRTIGGAYILNRSGRRLGEFPDR